MKWLARWSRRARWFHAVLTSSALLGCQGARHIHYLGDADLQYYQHQALSISHPNTYDPTPDEVLVSQRPRTIRDRQEEDEIWNLSLSEAVHLAIANNKLIRTINGQGQLLNNPTQYPSIYDPALRATGFLFGNRGVEAALSDFDAQFTTQMIWGRNETVGGLFPFPGFINANETGNFSSQISKTLATGGNFSVSHNWNYLGTNQPGALFPSSYTGNLRVDFTQPLWAGSGVEFTRIAGPARPGLGGLIGVSQGVTIARINEDISLADFENAVIQMVKDVEDTYWDLYLAYRQYDAESKNRDSAYETWRQVRALMKVGARGGGAGEEAQARENYFEVRARVETALSNIYSIENQFRKLLGLPVNDGRIIRPSDDPLRAEYVVNWESALADALTRRVELRRQKWQVKSLELQRLAALNAANPQLNFVSSYQVNGFGDKLFSNRTEDGITGEGFNSAYGSLTRGDETGWTLGFQFSVPIGLRLARAQLHNIELQLAKARAALAAQELDISHDLADAIQQVDLAYMTAQTHYDRRVASELRVATEQARWNVSVEGASIDLLLRAQASLAAAEVAYFSSLVNYNKALVNLHLRRGTLLEVNNITLAEEAWHHAAQDEALRRAWARSFGWPAPRLHTSPEEFSSPVPYPKTDLIPTSEDTSLPPTPHNSTTPAEPLPTVPPSESHEAPLQPSQPTATNGEPPVGHEEHSSDTASHAAPSATLHSLRPRRISAPEIQTP
ncbi:MAG: secretion protein [Planctomycetaceae bacterium]|nr:MAG: secretion protein [Planctomycetaceae bacterium]